MDPFKALVCTMIGVFVFTAVVVAPIFVWAGALFLAIIKGLML